MEKLRSSRNIRRDERTTTERVLSARRDDTDPTFACPRSSCARIVPGLFEVRFIDGLVDERWACCAWCLASLRAAEAEGEIYALEVLGLRGRPLAHVLVAAA